MTVRLPSITDRRETFPRKRIRLMTSRWPTGSGNMRRYMEASLTFDSPNPELTLARVREIAKVVQERGDGWPSLEEWRTLLPAWFLDASASESTREEVEAYLQKWQAVTPEERAEEDRSRPWSLIGSTGLTRQVTSPMVAGTSLAAR
ncbi:MAG TPA: hypothetical protein VGW38_22730 [Chloroflexota bacterium]|nr:hypothetical protein [Chloroflexota bacterium]